MRVDKPDEHPRPPRWRRRWRLRVLVGGLVALLTIHLASGLRLDFLPNFLGGTPPLEPWITEQVVLDALDGRQATHFKKSDAADGGIEFITIRKDSISSLAVRSSGADSALVRFDLERDGKRYLVEGSLEIVPYRGDGADGWIDERRFSSFDGVAIPSP